jgi:hypothetical protein
VPERPLLLLDVDGVLNPYPETPAGYAEHDFFPEDDEPVRLAGVHGGWLHELADSFDVVWATGWGDEAIRLLGPHFGLATFPLLPLPPVPFDAIAKWREAEGYVNDRAVAWVDDLLPAEAHSWAKARREPTLLLRVDHRTGLTRDHVDRLLAWAAEVEAST